MQNLYGPAIALGLIIGAAIIADDFIRPTAQHRDMPLPAGLMFAPADDSDHKVWIMNQAGDEDRAVHREMRIVLNDESDKANHEKTLIMVKVDDDQADARAGGEALAEAIREAVDAARAEGREPTEAEITAAISAVSGQTSHIEVEVDVSKARQQAE